TGLPKGFPDLFGFRGTDGKMFFIEVKNEIGKLRQEQRNFQQAMEITPAICGVARSVEEALKIVEGL
ncbi:VRR-NUC domain-containing protein, partial [Listeria monocytogenes]|nr:VRR-NUC domain-containing protein [Listeria monocytogenes]